MSEQNIADELRDAAMDNLARKLTAAEAELTRLREVVEKLDEACNLIEVADNRAMAVDGDVPPTAQMLDCKELQTILSAVWSTRIASKNEGPET